MYFTQQRTDQRKTILICVLPHLSILATTI
jgi:hypothetical protein